MKAGLRGIDPDTAPLSKGGLQWPTVLLLVVGLVLSLGSFAMLRGAELSRAQAEFATEAERWRALAQEQLTQTVYSLRSVSALLDSSEEVTREEFRSFTETIVAVHPEILSIEWLPRVSADQRRQFEGRAHAEGLTDYVIKDVREGRASEAPVRAEHFPVYYIEPFVPNLAVLGVDYAARPERFRAMMEACDSGELVSATGFDLSLRGVEPGALHVMVFLPRYSPGDPPRTVDERRARLEGFVAVIFEMGAVLNGVLKRFNMPGVDLEVHAEKRRALGARAATASASSPVSPISSVSAGRLQRESKLELPHLTLRMIVRATPEFSQQPNYASAWAALAAGLAMTALALGYLKLLRRQFAERQELELERDRLFNLTPDLLCIAGLDGRFKQLSPAWERTLGYSRTELMSHPFAFFVHPEDVEATERCMRELAAGRAVLDFENRYRRRDGAWRLLEWRAISAPEQNLIYASARDMTEQRETHLALERARHFAERATQIMPSVLYVDDLIEHRNVFTNRQGALALGLPERYFPSSGTRAVEKLMHEEDVPRYLEHRARMQTLADDEIAQITYRMRHADGSWRWFHARDSVFERDADGVVRLVIGTATDITATKRAEEERSRMEERMRHSQKMEALGALAGGIAHDFNNILTAITGNARLLLHELPSDDPMRVSLEEIDRAAKRATDLVSRILAFSRNEEPALRQVDLGLVVDEAVRLLRATMPAMVGIRVEPSAPIPPVLADATQIHQVIMNLGANARDAMGEHGGVLTIGLREVAIDAELNARAPELRGQTCVCLTVEDTGVGMTREVLARIFDPFFTTKPAGHGTGMGLAMVHGIIRRHGGVVLATSEPGRGTKFELYFPVAAQSREAEETPEKLAGVQANGERILYVDDEEPLVFLATRMLTRLGFQVDGHTDAREALREFARDPYRWDLVISDLGMPGMSGLDLAAELLRIRPDLPLMLTSGYVRLEDAERARMIGAEDIVLKPNTVEEMAPLVLERLASARDKPLKQAPSS